MKKTATKDLRRLFGEPVSSLANFVGLDALEITPALMDAVQDAADALLKLRGQHHRQRAHLADLPFTVRLVLFMWLSDTKLAAKLIRAAYAKG